MGNFLFRLDAAEKVQQNISRLFIKRQAAKQRTIIKKKNMSRPSCVDLMKTINLPLSIIQSFVFIRRLCMGKFRFCSLKK